MHDHKFSFLLDLAEHAGHAFEFEIEVCMRATKSAHLHSSLLKC